MNNIASPTTRGGVDQSAPGRRRRLVSQREVDRPVLRAEGHTQVEVLDQFDPQVLGAARQGVVVPVAGVPLTVGQKSRAVTRHIAERAVPGGVGARTVVGAVFCPAAARRRARLPRRHAVVADAREVDVHWLAEEAAPCAGWLSLDRRLGRGAEAGAGCELEIGTA